MYGLIIVIVLLLILLISFILVFMEKKKLSTGTKVETNTGTTADNSEIQYFYSLINLADISQVSTLTEKFNTFKINTIKPIEYAGLFCYNKNDITILIQDSNITMDTIELYSSSTKLANLIDYTIKKSDTNFIISLLKPYYITNIVSQITNIGNISSISYIFLDIADHLTYKKAIIDNIPNEKFVLNLCISSNTYILNYYGIYGGYLNDYNESNNSILLLTDPYIKHNIIPTSDKIIYINIRSTSNNILVYSYTFLDENNNIIPKSYNNYNYNNYMQPINDISINLFELNELNEQTISQVNILCKFTDMIVNVIYKSNRNALYLRKYTTSNPDISIVNIFFEQLSDPIISSIQYIPTYTYVNMVDNYKIVFNEPNIISNKLLIEVNNFYYSSNNSILVGVNVLGGSTNKDIRELNLGTEYLINIDGLNANLLINNTDRNNNTVTLATPINIQSTTLPNQFNSVYIYMISLLFKLHTGVYSMTINTNNIADNALSKSDQLMVYSCYNPTISYDNKFGTLSLTLQEHGDVVLIDKPPSNFYISNLIKTITVYIMTNINDSYYTANVYDSNYKINTDRISSYFSDPNNYPIPNIKNASYIKIKTSLADKFQITIMLTNYNNSVSNQVIFNVNIPALTTAHLKIEYANDIIGFFNDNPVPYIQPVPLQPHIEPTPAPPELSTRTSVYATIDNIYDSINPYSSDPSLNTPRMFTSYFPSISHREDDTLVTSDSTMKCKELGFPCNYFKIKLIKPDPRYGIDFKPVIIKYLSLSNKSIILSDFNIVYFDSTNNLMINITDTVINRRSLDINFQYDDYIVCISLNDIIVTTVTIFIDRPNNITDTSTMIETTLCNSQMYNNFNLSSVDDHNLELLKGTLGIIFKFVNLIVYPTNFDRKRLCYRVDNIGPIPYGTALNIRICGTDCGIGKEFYNGQCIDPSI